MNPNLKAKMVKKVRHQLAEKQDRIAEKILHINEDLCRLKRTELYHGKDAVMETAGGKAPLGFLQGLGRRRIKFLQEIVRKSDKELIELHDALEATLSAECKKDNYAPKSESDLEVLAKCDLIVICMGFLP